MPPYDFINIHLERLLSSRAWPKTICPSEVARALASSELDQMDAENWREAMPAIRDLTSELRASGEVEVLQRGQVIALDVSLEDIRGPFRIRKTRTALD